MIANLEYDTFLGAPYERVYYDWTRRAYVRCICQQPKTPQDRVTPATGEEAMQAERLPFTPGVGGREGIQPDTIKLLLAVKGLIAVEPLTSVQLAHRLRGVGESISHVLYKYGARYGIARRRLEYDKRKWVWYLAEVDNA